LEDHDAGKGIGARHSRGPRGAAELAAQKKWTATVQWCFAALNTVERPLMDCATFARPTSSPPIRGWLPTIGAHWHVRLGSAHSRSMRIAWGGGFRDSLSGSI